MERTPIYKLNRRGCNIFNTKCCVFFVFIFKDNKKAELYTLSFLSALLISRLSYTSSRTTSIAASPLRGPILTILV